MGGARISGLRADSTHRAHTEVAIKPARNTTHLIVAAAASLGLVGLQGCAPGNNSPFHIYDSPLLAGDFDSNYPRSRSYDPFASKQGGGPTRAVRDADGAKPASVEIASAGRDTSSDMPPLISQKRQHPTQKGAPAPDEESARSAPQPAPETRPAQPRSGAAADAADYIWSVYALNGVAFPADSRRSLPALFRACKDRGEIDHSTAPAIGDIVFFHNSVDSNQDGRNNDWYTHAGIVESHADNGSVTLLSYRGDKVDRLIMSLESPDASMDRHGGKLNSQLRAPADDDAPFTQYLAGQLFAGTCSALGERAQFVIVDNWEPGMHLEK
ncbi:CHAP domain-containing protein [Bradymonas sediminis]|nr:CHAP domain-containing protein [Bradymonas sediminis]TDP76790.1 hypothetical protein DFR33_102427 [Bradymonas sediminis]